MDQLADLLKAQRGELYMELDLDTNFSKYALDISEIRPDSCYIYTYVLIRLLLC